MTSIETKFRSVHRRAGGRRQRGVTVVVVLVLLSVMLMGGLALARLGEVGTLVAGNVASKEAAMQATEIGTARAFQAIRSAGFDPNVDVGNWYYATAQATDANGVPTVTWEGVPETKADRFTLKVVVERMCDKPIVVDVVRDCLVREYQSDLDCKGATCPDPINALQYRVTVRATDLKGGQTWVQAMIN